MNKNWWLLLFVVSAVFAFVAFITKNPELGSEYLVIQLISFGVYSILKEIEKLKK